MASSMKEGMSKIFFGFIILCKIPKADLETFFFFYLQKNHRITDMMGCIDSENKEMGRFSELARNYASGARISWRNTYFYLTKT